MGIAEEVAAAGRPPRMGCGVCDFIATRPDAEQAEWDAVMERHVSHRAIHRVLVAHGYDAASENPVIAHRTRRHRRHD